MLSSSFGWFLVYSGFALRIGVTDRDTTFSCSFDVAVYAGAGADNAGVGATHETLAVPAGRS